MIIVPRNAQQVWLVFVLDMFKGADEGDNPLLRLRLYRNDIAPTLTTVLADFVEANFPGYGPRNIGADFGAPFLNAEGFSQSNGPTEIWTPTNQSSNTITHGWYLTYQTDLVPAVLIAAERIVPGVPMNKPGALVRVQPKLTLGSRFAS